MVAVWYCVFVGPSHHNWTYRLGSKSLIANMRDRLRMSETEIPRTPNKTERDSHGRARIRSEKPVLLAAVNGSVGTAREWTAFLEPTHKLRNGAQAALWTGKRRSGPRAIRVGDGGLEGKRRGERSNQRQPRPRSRNLHVCAFRSGLVCQQHVQRK